MIAPDTSRLVLPAALSLSLRGVALLVGLTWITVTQLPPLNADAAAILQFAQRMLDGERLYLDLIDINPPLIFWLSAGLVAMGNGVGLSATTSLITGIQLLILTSLLASGLLFARSHAGQQPVTRLLLPLAAILTLCVYPGQSFGQREHLLLILVLPYATLTLLHLEGQRVGKIWQIVVSLAALMGICLKPHFAALPALVEASLLIELGQRRWLQCLPSWIFLFGGLGYIGFTWGLHPAYFTEILPMATAHYGTMRIGTLPALVLGEQLPPLLIALAGLMVLGWRSGRPHGVARLLIALALGATLAALFQWKDWSYHFLPARVLIILAGAAVVGVLLADLPDRMEIRAVAGLMVPALFLAGFGADPFLAQRNFPNSEGGRILTAIRGEAQGQRILWLTQYIDPTAPVLNYLDARLAMPYMSLWLLPALYEGTADPSGRVALNSADHRPPAERKLLEDVGVSLERWHPRLILVGEPEGEAAFAHTDFDYIRYFRQEPRFAAEWQHYERIGKIGATALYRRIDTR